MVIALSSQVVLYLSAPWFFLRNKLESVNRNLILYFMLTLTFRLKILLLLTHLSLAGCQPEQAVEVWLTTPDKTFLFEQVPYPKIKLTNDTQHPTITINSAKTFQEIDGFGYTLNGGSAMWLMKMNAQARSEILQELFGTEGNAIGVSYLRVSVGASDLDERVFSYSDLPEGSIDPELLNFSLDYDTLYLIPVLKEILAINPSIMIMGSPWSAPIWMKSNRSAIGGYLLPEFYQSYALYFVKYIQGMREHGIRIDAITVQNEPLHPGNNPSMYMSAQDQATFVRDYLGPMFQKHSIDTKIVIYDHNADRIDYPISILNDTVARRFIDGSAFHLYGGVIEELSKVHEAHPDKNLYFTEQWIGAPADFANDMKWHIENLIVGATRNWCRTVLEWNLAADPNQKPHTDRGGCTRCLGAITIDGDRVERNPAYYIIAHASKFVRPGSVRIYSNVVPSLPNVAFKTPNGDYVLIAINTSNESMVFSLALGEKSLATSLDAGAVATYVIRN